MKRLVATLNSDSKNLYNQVFPASTLEQGLRQRWRSGTICNLGHDVTRPFGWMHPISLFYEPQITKLMGLLQVPETETEAKHFANARVEYLQAEQQQQCLPYEGILRERLGGNLTDSGVTIDAGCAAFFDDGLAQKQFPEVFDLESEDGLVNVGEMKHLGGGVFDVNGLELFAHRFFRRSFSILNTINQQFFAALEEISRRGIEVWLALDHDLVGWSESYRPYIELEYWWGPQFSDDLSSITPGLTRHGSTEFERYYAGISATEFWWQSRKGEHILEIEELRDVPQSTDGADYGCRYIHCIVNEDSKSVVHMDGAVRNYPEAHMIRRLDQKITEAGRNADYTKLWRTDADVPVDLWKRLVSDYFRDNHLVGEYLIVETEDREARPTTMRDIETSFSIKQKYVGYGIDKGSGARVNLSYHLSATKQHGERSVLPLDSVTVDGDRITVIELWTYEIQKILKRMHHDLYIPEDVRLIACEDMYINVPLIVHHGVSSVHTTFEAIKELLNWSESRSHDRAVSLSVSYPLKDDDRNLRLSLYGQCADLLDFLKADVARLPEQNNEIPEWCDQVAAWMQRYSPADRPIPHDIIQPSGILWLKRRPVPEDIDIKVKYCDQEKGVKYKANIPSKYRDLGKSMQSGEISLRCCFLIEEVVCSCCKEDYLQCNCSAVLDGGHKIIRKGEPLGAFLTDRPA